VFLRSAKNAVRHDRYWDGADLVIEVLNDHAIERYRDLITTRQEYARAGILEYWIVDPRAERITVLHLKDDQYVEHGVFARGAVATSVLLPDRQVNVDAALDAE